MVSKETLEEIEYYSKHPWNEKTAKDMFEELGYHKIEDAITIQYLRYDNQQIRFWKDSKQIELFGGYELELDLENNQYFTDNFELFIAINKQVKELGW